MFFIWKIIIKFQRIRRWNSSDRSYYYYDFSLLSFSCIQTEPQLNSIISRMRWHWYWEQLYNYCERPLRRRRVVAKHALIARIRIRAALCIFAEVNLPGSHCTKNGRCSKNGAAAKYLKTNYQTRTHTRFIIIIYPWYWTASVSKFLCFLAHCNLYFSTYMLRAKQTKINKRFTVFSHINIEIESIGV